MATQNFSDAELACHCGCGLLPDEKDQIDLQMFRDQYDHPMRISSAIRCPEYNSRISRTGQDGPHTTFAIDVLCYGEEARKLLELAVYWWDGIGLHQRGPVSKRFIHLDNLTHTPKHPRPRVWSY